MQLSAHFKLEEFTRSSTAKEKGLKNDPSEAGIALAKEMCEKVLEPIRAKFGAIKINSGYRSPEVNSAVSGSATSDHVWDEFGCACDTSYKVPLEQVFEWLRLESSLPFDQVILERGKEERHEFDDCIHIGYRPQPRRQAKRGETHNRSKYTTVEVV